jgi:MFS superfamily sulfate permease-like transporter
MFGFPRDPVTDDSPLSSLIYFFSSIGDTNMTAFTAALLTVLFLLVFIVWKRRQPDSKVAAKFPSILFAVILGTLLSYLLDLESYGVVVLGHVDSGFQRPSDTLPKLSRADIGPVISKASVLALLNFIETFVVAKHYAQQSGETISPNRELVALGFANVVGSLFGAYPASGSLTRSKVNHEAGATTPAAGFFASLIVMFAILFMLPLLVCLPRPVVSAIIVTVTAGIMNFKELALCFRLRLWPDFFLSLGIFTSVCLFGIDQSIILAIVMCFLWLVKSIAVIQPRILILGQLHVSKMREKALQFIAQAKLIEESMQEHDEMTIAEAESLTGDAEQPETDALLSPVGRLNRLDSISEDITVAPVPASISTVHSIAIPPTAPSSLASTISDVKPVLTQRRASLIPSLVALEAALTQPAVTNSLRLAAAVTSPGSHQFDFSSSATSSMPGTNDNVVEYVDIEEFPQAEPVPGMILLKLTGALNFSTIGRIEVLFRRLIQFGSISHHPGDLSNATELPEDDIVLDLSEIPSLDGSAVSSFVDILTSISKRGRRVLVVGAREAVVALLIRIKRFRSLSNGGTIYSTMHDAVTHLQQQQQRRGLTSVPGSVRNSPKVSRRSMH